LNKKQKFIEELSLKNNELNKNLDYDVSQNKILINKKNNKLNKKQKLIEEL
jgi:hypothetical protein